ncbi:hypothetical protein [Methylobacterium sp. WL19]|uniref:hypothetical protein n=1 Tax=Methylobacterium sp. WL19 TaxID=2603896 RepID=UPI0011CB5292|nr:hypothetical protein [Methylobacterium sp. WL19]TXN28869.1 hypothetical protein FV220_08055 [Methylobacterium sp. WL19]
MAGTYVTTPRPYYKINISVQNCRELASLGSSIDFSITEFIVGPLIDHFRGRLGIEYILQDEVAGPAEVVINGDKTSILLRVSKEMWAAASRGEAEGRRILAHEIDTSGFIEMINFYFQMILNSIIGLFHLNALLKIKQMSSLIYSCFQIKRLKILTQFKTLLIIAIIILAYLEM